MKETPNKRSQRFFARGLAFQDSHLRDVVACCSVIGGLQLARVVPERQIDGFNGLITGQKRHNCLVNRRIVSP